METLKVDVLNTEFTEVVSSGSGFITNNSFDSCFYFISTAKPADEIEGHVCFPNDFFNFDLIAGESVWVRTIKGNGMVYVSSGVGKNSSSEGGGSSAEPFFVSVSKGNISGQQNLNIAGYNPDIDISTSPEDLWSEGGELVYMTSENLLDIYSTDPADVGPLSVFIGGVDENYNLITDTVVLNGTTTVPTNIPFFRINFMFLVGTGLANVGAIYAVEPISGDVQCRMADGRGITQHGFYTVPVGKSVIISQVEVNAAKLSGGGNPEMLVYIYARFSPTTPWIIILARKIDTSVENYFVIPFPTSGILSAGADIRMSATTDTNGADITMKLTGIVYDA